MSDMATARIQAILDFWFGELVLGLCSDERRAALFRTDPAFDAEIRTKFGAEVAQAVAGELDHWGTTIDGRQALILLLDQFTRNLYRGEAAAFSGDARALEIARGGVARGDDLQLPTEMRAFFYLPFEHSESLADQETCIALLVRMRDELPTGSRARHVAERYLQHARDHHALVAEFGRFPHRNAVLERADTAVEAAWLARDGRSFGQ